MQDQPLTMGETPDLTLTITLLRLGSAALLGVWRCSWLISPWPFAVISGCEGALYFAAVPLARGQVDGHDTAVL